jgi:phi LC3 family holin
MNINWKLRLQNKAILTAIVLGIIAIVFQILAICDVAPAVTQNEIVQVATMVIEVLALCGIVVDPTTAGISDSVQAMGYIAPKSSSEDEGDA